GDEEHRGRLHILGSPGDKPRPSLVGTGPARQHGHRMAGTQQAPAKGGTDEPRAACNQNRLALAHDLTRSPSRAATVRPISLKFSTTITFAAFRAWILDSYVPVSPSMMAPACPMRRPAGAVRPAMNE